MLNRLKISLILVPLALMMLVGVYIYSLWSEDRDRRAEIPFDATQVMNRDLLKFHQKRGSFPEKLEDLEGVVWEKKKERKYVSHGRSMMHRNYFYMYSRLNSHRYTLWAIPIGKAREEASTLFLIGTPTSDRRWKGPVLPVPDIENLLSAPSSNNLNMLGLAEQPNTPRESKSK